MKKFWMVLAVLFYILFVVDLALGQWRDALDLFCIATLNLYIHRLKNEIEATIN